MAKRNMWTYEETIEMLNIMLEQHSLKAMNGRPFRRDKAFRLVQEEMETRGYHAKDIKQIENRWKNLKKRYMDIQKNPSLATSQPFQYYGQIDLMMAGKPPATETKLWALSISKVSPQQNTSIESTSIEANCSAMEALEDMDEYDEELKRDDSAVCEPVTAKSPDVPQPSTVRSVPKRSKRCKTGGTSRRSGAYESSSSVHATFTEQDVFHNQKSLIDYQFGLYSRAQEESDKKFLDMTRQMFEECNDRFQSFFEKLMTDNETGSC
uniref:Myb/SANT-like DNA-binding domain-containing protein n=1 Tax=Anopheles dirus TaxID=7168 RepID=A0A182NFL6_9DIPT